MKLIEKAEQPRAPPAATSLLSVEQDDDVVGLCRCVDQLLLSEISYSYNVINSEAPPIINYSLYISFPLLLESAIEAILNQAAPN